MKMTLQLEVPTLGGEALQRSAYPGCSVAGGKSALALPTLSESMVIEIDVTSSVNTISRGVVTMDGVTVKFGNAQVTAPVFSSTMRWPALPSIATPSSVACRKSTAPQGVLVSS